MSQTSYLSDVTIQNLLDEHAQNLLSGNLNRKTLLSKYGVKSDNPVVRLLDIAERTHSVYSDHEPSQEFVNQLYKELIGSTSRPFWSRFSRGSRKSEHLPSLPNLQQVDLQRLKELQPTAIQLAAGLGGLTLMWIAARAVRDTIGTVDSEDNLLAKLSVS